MLKVNRTLLPAVPAEPKARTLLANSERTSRIVNCLRNFFKNALQAQQTNLTTVALIATWKDCVLTAAPDLLTRRILAAYSHRLRRGAKTSIFQLDPQMPLQRRDHPLLHLPALRAITQEATLRVDRLPGWSLAPFWVFFLFWRF